MDQNTTVDRLTEMLYEERNDRIDISSNLVSATQLMQQLKIELADAHQSLWEANEKIWELREQNRELTSKATVNPFLQSDVERLREALTRLANEHRADFEQPVVNIIPVIKEVREKFGIGLKEAKEIVDQWRLDDATRAQAEEMIAKEDPGTFDEDENPFLTADELQAMGRDPGLRDT